MDILKLAPKQLFNEYSENNNDLIKAVDIKTGDVIRDE